MLAPASVRFELVLATANSKGWGALCSVRSGGWFAQKEWRPTVFPWEGAGQAAAATPVPSATPQGTPPADPLQAGGILGRAGTPGVAERIKPQVLTNPRSEAEKERANKWRAHHKVDAAGFV